MNLNMLNYFEEEGERWDENVCEVLQERLFKQLKQQCFGVWKFLLRWTVQWQKHIGHLFTLAPSSSSERKHTLPYFLAAFPCKNVTY